MVLYERDPRLRRWLAILLACGEIVALTVVMLVISAGGMTWFNARLLGSRLGAAALFATPLVASAAAFLVFFVQGVLYVKGRPWTRSLFILENLLMIVVGAIWFLKNQFGEDPNRNVALMALVLPVATLFPLLWPLRVFRPVPPGGP